MIPLIVTVAPVIGVGKFIPPSVAAGGGGDSPRDRGATVREYFLTLPLIICGVPRAGSHVTHRSISVGEAHDHITRVVRCIGDRGVQRNADYGFIANGLHAKASLVPALQLDASHRLGHALGANRVRTALEGETLLRLRHAAARQRRTVRA